MVRLFHVSDVHFGAEDPAALAWFAQVVRDERPDAVVMTGDLTMRALPTEFASGEAWLRSLEVPTTVEPGNHDIPYYSDPLRRLFRPYRRYLAVERAIERPLTLPGVSVVPLKTVARLQWRMNQSKGRVSARSLAEALVRIAAAPKGSVVLVAAHHPLDGRGTRGGEAALAALAAAGADAVLTGHVHVPFDEPRQAGGRTIRLVGAGTLSKRVRHAPPGFNELRVEGGRLTVMSRVLPE